MRAILYYEEKADQNIMLTLSVHKNLYHHIELGIITCNNERQFQILNERKNIASVFECSEGMI
jgi:hypothetical protein